MSTPTRHAPTRRTVLRAAAWTAPAVSIAVAAPAFATSVVTPPSGAVTAPNAPYKGTVSGSLKHVSWDGLTLRNTSNTVAIVSFQIVFTGYAENASTRPDTMQVTSISSPGGTWSANPATLTATWTGSLAAGQSLRFNVRFTGSNNSGGTLSMTASSGSTSFGTVSGKF